MGKYIEMNGEILDEVKCTGCEKLVGFIKKLDIGFGDFWCADCIPKEELKEDKEREGGRNSSQD